MRDNIQPIAQVLEPTPAESEIEGEVKRLRGAIAHHTNALDVLVAKLAGVRDMNASSNVSAKVKEDGFPKSTLGHALRCAADSLDQLTDVVNEQNRTIAL